MPSEITGRNPLMLRTIVSTGNNQPTINHRQLRKGALIMHNHVRRPLVGSLERYEQILFIPGSNVAHFQPLSK